MKKGIHPDNYRPVVFKDMSNEDVFITRSTINAKETIEIDGVTYPLVKIEISSSSHPFYTGKAKLVDTAGRVDKFMSRYGNRNKNSSDLTTSVVQKASAIFLSLSTIESGSSLYLDLYNVKLLDFIIL